MKFQHKYGNKNATEVFGDGVDRVSYGRGGRDETERQKTNAGKRGPIQTLAFMVFRSCSYKTWGRNTRCFCAYSIQTSVYSIWAHAEQGAWDFNINMMEQECHRSFGGWGVDCVYLCPDETEKMRKKDRKEILGRGCQSTGRHLPVWFPLSFI